MNFGQYRIKICVREAEAKDARPSGGHCAAAGLCAVLP